MKISVIVASRKNSKFLAQFLFGYLTHTADFGNTELLVMHSAEDTWNKDLFRYFSGIHAVTFLPENYGLGRKGHHVYLNELARLAQGEWILELCEDMAFLTDGWDQKLRAAVVDKCYKHVWMLRPHFKPADHAMAHLVSRGYLEAAGNLAESWSVDSWINTVFERACFNRVVDCPSVWFYDYTHDPHNYFDPADMQGVVDEAKARETGGTWNEPRMPEAMDRTVWFLREAVRNGY